jgi:Ca2+-binding RTX toxin-like protein
LAFQSATDIYIMEGTPSPYVVLALASLDVAVESDSFVQINSSDPLVVVGSSDPILGPGVTIFGSQRQADVPFIISFDDPTSAGLDVTLTLTLYHNGLPTGDTTTINLHVLDSDDPNRPTGIVVNGDSVAEDAATGTVVTTLSTIDPTPGDTFTYTLNDTTNFAIVGNQIVIAENSQIDFETQQTQSLQVVTTDAAGHSFVKDITINITDVQPDLDVVTGALIQDVQENASVQVDLRLSDFVDPVGITSVSGDTDFFTLVNAPVGSGIGFFDFSLVFNPQDFETPLDANGDNIYDYTITVFDGVQTTSRTFHFTVTDVSPETLNGTENGDTLIGGSGVEFIFGFAGNDILNGMENNDKLTGGLGKDWLTGGLGADIFDFDLKTETPKGANRDVIMDFHRVELDHIDLSDIDAKSKTKTVDDHFKFIGAKAFHHKAGELHYLKKAHFLLVEGDMDGNGKANFQIEVHGVTKLGALDFNL